MRTFVTLLVGLVLGFAIAAMFEDAIRAAERSKEMRTLGDAHAIAAALDLFGGVNGCDPPFGGGLAKLQRELVPSYRARCR